MMKRFSLICIGTIANTAMALAHHAPADSVRMYKLNEFEVMGQRKATLHMSKLPLPLSKLPMSVSQINGDELRNRGIYDIQTAAKFLPGVNIRTTYGAFQQMSIRGFDYAPIHFDGLRDERSTINSYPLSDLSTVESIEVLKGPAGVLFGHSAVGGAMNIVRKQANGVNELFARVALGSYGYRQSTFAKGGKLAGPVNYYTSLNYSNQDGFRKINDGRFNWYGTLRAQWGANDFILRGTFHRDFYATDAGLPKMLRDSVYQTDGTLFMAPYTLNPYIKDINARYNNESDFMYNRGASISGKYTHRFSDYLTLTDHFIVSHDDIDYFSTEELTYPESQEPIYPHYYMAKGAKKYIDLMHVRLTYPLRFSHIADMYQNQLDLNGAFSSGFLKHNYLFGAALSYMRRTSYRGYNVEGADDPKKFIFPGSPDVYGPGVQSLVSVEEPGSMGYMCERFSDARPSHTLTGGLYVQDLVEVGSKLQMLLSLRYDYYIYERASVLVIDRMRKFKDPGRDAYNRSVSQSFTYRAGAVYEPLQGWQVYGSVSSFFKPDQTFFNPNIIYVNAKGKEFVPEENGEIFDPLQGYQGEVGTRWALGKFATFNASVYYIRQYNAKKNLGTQKRKINNKEIEMSIIGQVGTITSQGFEADVTLTPLHGLMLTAGYGFSDIRYTKLASNPHLKTDAQVGNPLNYVPKHNFYTYGSYVVDNGILRGLGLNYSLTYTGMIYRDYVRKESYPRYAILGAGISHRFAKDVTARFQVDNILNTSVFSRSLGLQPMPNQPRTFNFSVTYHLR